LHARLFAGSLVAVAAAFGQATQQGAGPDITIHMDVRQVLVQVVVKDKEGHRVTGLKASDFKVLEDNAPEQITSLTTGLEATVMEIRGENQSRKTRGETGNAATNLTEAGVRTTYLICVDALHSSFANFSRVRSALSKFLKEEQGDDSQYGLVVIGREPVMVQPFTSDPRTVLESVRGKEFQKAIRSNEAIGLSADVANLKQMADDYCGKCPCGLTAPSNVEGVCAAKKAEMQAFVTGTANRTASLTTSFLRQLQGVIAQLSRSPTGRRLLLISDGFTLEPGRELYGTLSAFMPNDPGWRFNPRDAEPELEPILRFALANNVAVYSLDSRGVYGPGDIGGLADASTRGVFRPSAGTVQLKIDEQASTVAAGNATVMELLAQSTGGAFFQNSNDLVDGIRRSFADGRQYYLIAYTPVNKAMDGGFRRITVQVKDKSWSVQAKAGYWASKETMPVEAIREKPTDSQPASPPGAPVKTDRATPDLASGVSAVKVDVKSLAGTVSRVSGQTVVVALEDTRFVLVQLSPSTVISLAEGSARVGQGLELRPGLWVKVKATFANARAVLAESIEIGSAPESAATVPARPGSPPSPENQPAWGTDATILKAREAALRLARALPDFICRQTISRYTQVCKTCGWTLEDRVSSEVLYGGEGGETYRDVRTNQNRSSTPLTDMRGAISEGEFGTSLQSLFHSTFDSDFHFMKEVSVKGRKERVYNYGVSAEHSDWVITNNYEFVVAPYSGRIWIDLQTGRVMRLEKTAAEFPKAFALGRVNSEIEYGEIRLGDSQNYFLPIRGEARVCSAQIGSLTACAHNEIEFRNYRKYSGDSKISFQ